jgi:hypothetical protein
VTSCVLIMFVVAPYSSPILCRLLMICERSRHLVLESEMAEIWCGVASLVSVKAPRPNQTTSSELTSLIQMGLGGYQLQF